MSTPIAGHLQRRPSAARWLCWWLGATSALACGSHDGEGSDSTGTGAATTAGQTAAPAGATNEGGSATSVGDPGSGGTATEGAGGGGIVGAGGSSTGGIAAGGAGAGGTGAGGVSSGGEPALGGVGGAGVGGGSDEGGASGHAVGGGEPGGSSGAAAGGQTTGGASGGAGSGGEVHGGGGQGGATTGGGAPDGGTGGTVEPDCPDRTDYVGDPAWPHRLEVTDGAEYCGAFDELRDLDQEYAVKAKIRIAPGNYPLADIPGTYAFALPVCFEGKPGSAMPSFAGVGEVEVLWSENPLTSYASYSHVCNQPLSLSDTGTWSFQGHTSYWETAAPPLPLPHPLDGTPLDAWGDTGHATELWLCEGVDCDQWDDVRFEACAADYPRQLNVITFEGGEVTFELGITGGVGTEEMLSVFPRASGTLDGTPFTQTDYFKLVYSADHHHFIRSFAVLFDQPIGDACGLKVLEVITHDPTVAPQPREHLVDVDYGMSVVLLNLGGADSHLFRQLNTGIRYVHTLTAMERTALPKQWRRRWSTHGLRGFADPRHHTIGANRSASPRIAGTSVERRGLARGTPRRGDCPGGSRSAVATSRRGSGPRGRRPAPRLLPSAHRVRWR